MERLSKHLGKTIINITSAEELGKLANIAMRDMVITHIVSSDNIAISSCDIVSMGAYILVKSSGEKMSNLNPITTIGGVAVSDSGVAIGEINDYEFTKAFKLKGVICGETYQIAEKIAVFNNNYMIFNKKRKPLPSNKKQIASDNNLKVSLQTDMSPKAHPGPTISDCSFLVGRIITRDIIDGHKRLFCLGNTITDTIVSTAKAHNKLVELTLFSQKN